VRTATVQPFTVELDNIAGPYVTLAATKTLVMSWRAPVEGAGGLITAVWLQPHQVRYEVEVVWRLEVGRSPVPYHGARRGRIGSLVAPESVRIFVPASATLEIFATLERPIYGGTVSNHQMTAQATLHGHFLPIPTEG